MPTGTVCEPGQPQVYYQWQTGSNQWSQSLWLTKTADSSVVAFDPPVNLAYVVPTGTAYGSWGRQDDPAAVHTLRQSVRNPRLLRESGGQQPGRLQHEQFRATCRCSRCPMAMRR